jgi:hypothetical protein
VKKQKTIQSSKQNKTESTTPKNSDEEKINQVHELSLSICWTKKNNTLTSGRTVSGQAQSYVLYMIENEA